MTATYPTHTAHAKGNGRVGIVSGLLHRVDEAITFLFDGIVRSNAMVQEYNRLSRLSDSQLAAEGLVREDIPNEVFKRLKA